MTRTALLKLILCITDLSVLAQITIWFAGGYESSGANAVGALIIGVLASLFIGMGLMLTVLIGGHSQQRQSTFAVRPSRLTLRPRFGGFPMQPVPIRSRTAGLSKGC